MPELSLDDDQRHAFSRHLNCVSVPELVWSEPPPYPGGSCGAVQLGPNASGAAPSPSRGSVQDAEERSDRKGLEQLDPRLELLPRPAVHPDLSPFAALALPHEDRATDGVKVRFGECERLADSQAGAPQHDDERTESDPVGIVSPVRMTEMISSTVGGSGG